MINGFQLLTAFTRSSILDVWQGSRFASEGGSYMLGGNKWISGVSDLFI